jgi:DNA polymerase IV
MSREKVLGRSLVLKLKTADFQLLTRSRRIDPPTRSAEALFVGALRLLERETDGRQFRLLGVGCSEIVPEETNPQPDLFQR